MTAPTLVCCSHGTDSAEGQRTISALVAAAERAVGAPTIETYVDVQHPQVDEVVSSSDGPAVIVPLLLSPGFHTAVDIGRAAAQRAGVVATGTLGPHPLLVDSLAERIAAFSPEPGDRVVLAAAGSSRPEAAARVEEMRTALEARIPVPVTCGFAYGAQPTVADAVQQAREAGAERVIAASYVLAPGHFADLISRAGADVVTAPLGVGDDGADPRIVRIIRERYDEGTATLSL
ncbi:sirohydrochlorin chelatase [Microbacterium sp.]|uniref:sirohydrochlorin chelatase n=1 Tax=Microbacterium sp. TaxID=51671 RepID=UPI003F973618